jgi:hypothetical protein
VSIHDLCKSNHDYYPRWIKSSNIILSVIISYTFRPFNFSYWHFIIDYATVLLWYCDTVLPFYCNAVLLCYHSTIVLCYCATVLVKDLVSIHDLCKSNHDYYPKWIKSSNIILSVITSYTFRPFNFSYLHCISICATVLLWNCDVVLPFYCSTVLLFFCATILLYYCADMILCFHFTIVLCYCTAVQV